jgi:hypothetical protein
MTRSQTSNDESNCKIHFHKIFPIQKTWTTQFYDWHYCKENFFCQNFFLFTLNITFYLAPMYCMHWKCHICTLAFATYYGGSHHFFPFHHHCPLTLFIYPDVCWTGSPLFFVGHALSHLIMPKCPLALSDGIFSAPQSGTG